MKPKRKGIFAYTTQRVVKELSATRIGERTIVGTRIRSSACVTQKMCTVGEISEPISTNDRTRRERRVSKKSQNQDTNSELTDALTN